MKTDEVCGRPRHPFAAHTHVSWSLSLQGISRLRARVGGFAVAPDTPSQCTPMQLDRYRWLGETELSPICATILSTCRRA